MISVDRILRAIDDDDAPGEREETELWTALEARSKTHPEEARTVLENDNLPLHSACYVLWRERPAGGAPRAASNAMRALVEAYPAALKARNAFGYLPCHCACRQRSVDVFRSILSRCPEAAGDGGNRYGQLPHHLSAVCRRSDLRILRELLLVDPRGAVVENGEGFTPLQAMWMHDCSGDNAGTLLEKAALTAVAGRIAAPPGDGTEPRQTTAAGGVPLPPEVATWAKVELLLMAARHGSVARRRPANELLAVDRTEETTGLIRWKDPSRAGGSGGGGGESGRPFLTCHAAVATGAPPIVVEIAATLYPEQLRRRDSDGRLPLHLAAGCASNVKTVPCHLCSSWKFSYAYRVVEKGGKRIAACDACFGSCLDFALSRGGRDDPSAEVPPNPARRSWVPSLSCADVERFAKREAKHPVTTLLEAHPDAARVPDDGGRLPLHHAAAASASSAGDWTRRVRPLVEACPGAVGMPDPGTKLLPFQMAAAATDAEGSSSSLRRLDVTYELLRYDPSCLGYVYRGSRKRGRELP